MMRNNRRISVKSPNLKNLRNGLRQIICKKAYEEIRRLRQSNLSSEVNELRRSINQSICICVWCNRTSTDMIYIAEEQESGFRPGWYCPRDYDFAVNSCIREEYEINPFLSVILKKYDVRVYIQGKKFLSCMLLRIGIPEPKYNSETADSIDELVEKYYYTDDGRKTKLNKEFIPIHTLFLAHCSNLQAWYDYGYDTRLLHRNIAFPLLKELTKAGDPQAKQVFKEEVARRYKNGNRTVREYLKIEGYLDFLSKEEKEAIGINLYLKT